MLSLVVTLFASLVCIQARRQNFPYRNFNGGEGGANQENALDPGELAELMNPSLDSLYDEHPMKKEIQAGTYIPRPPPQAVLPQIPQYNPGYNAYNNGLNYNSGGRPAGYNPMNNAFMNMMKTMASNPNGLNLLRSFFATNNGYNTRNNGISARNASPYPGNMQMIPRNNPYPSGNPGFNSLKPQFNPVMSEFNTGNSGLNSVKPQYNPVKRLFNPVVPEFNAGNSGFNGYNGGNPGFSRNMIYSSGNVPTNNRFSFNTGGGNAKTTSLPQNKGLKTGPSVKTIVDIIEVKPVPKAAPGNLKAYDTMGNIKKYQDMQKALGTNNLSPGKSISYTDNTFSKKSHSNQSKGSSMTKASIKLVSSKSSKAGPKDVISKGI